MLTVLDHLHHDPIPGISWMEIKASVMAGDNDLWNVSEASMSLMGSSSQTSIAKGALKSTKKTKQNIFLFIATIHWSHSIWSHADIQCGQADAGQCWHSHGLLMWGEGKLWHHRCHRCHAAGKLHHCQGTRGGVDSETGQSSRYSRFQVLSLVMTHHNCEWMMLWLVCQVLYCFFFAFMSFYVLP